LNEVDRVDPKSAPVEPQSKTVGTVDWSTLLVTLAASGGVLTTFIGAVQSWVSRHRQASITIKLNGDEITITDAVPSEQRRLINQWLKRHTT
jgi:hypothetical protein